MIPDFFPILTQEHIVPHPIKEYEDKYGRKSTVGWLKHLFLYRTVDKHSIQITPQDQKDYKSALDKFYKVNKIKSNKNLHDWEDETSPAKQASALNKLRRKMGYVVLK